MGADINAMSSQPWRQPQLQFIPGLGPRKAGALVKSLSGKDYVLTRLDLKAPSDPYAEARPCALLGTKVFTNAAPFIRVRAGDVAALANSDMDLQDDTRIHPEMEVALGWLCEETMPQADGDHIRAVIEEGRQELERVRRGREEGGQGTRRLGKDRRSAGNSPAKWLRVGYVFFFCRRGIQGAIEVRSFIRLAETTVYNTTTTCTATWVWWQG